MKSLSARHPTLPFAGLFKTLRALLTRKIWLPKLIYESLPLFYSLFGMMAITSTMFAPGWYWLMPFSWLLGLMCLHGAVLVWRVRRHYRRRSEQSNSEPQ